MEHRPVALIVGAGAGLGCSLGRRFARAEMNVALAARNVDKLETLAIECSGISHTGKAFACDATNEQEVEKLFRAVSADLGEPDLVVYNAGAFVRKSVLETDVAEFERCWRVGCLGGFLVGRAAARSMLTRTGRDTAHRTLIFTGATASLRGSAMFQNLAVGKFGLRALAQSMARELQPMGIHVAHVVIDGRIHPRSVHETTGQPELEDMLDPDAIAEAYYQLYCQPRSAWTLEMDLRPWSETF